MPATQGKRGGPRPSKGSFRSKRSSEGAYGGIELTLGEFIAAVAVSSHLMRDGDSPGYGGSIGSKFSEKMNHLFRETKYSNKHYSNIWYHQLDHKVLPYVHLGAVCLAVGAGWDRNRSIITAHCWDYSQYVGAMSMLPNHVLDGLKTDYAFKPKHLKKKDFDGPKFSRRSSAQTTFEEYAAEGEDIEEGELEFVSNSRFVTASAKKVAKKKKRHAEEESADESSESDDRGGSSSLMRIRGGTGRSSGKSSSAKGVSENAVGKKRAAPIGDGGDSSSSSSSSSDSSDDDSGGDDSGARYNAKPKLFEVLSDNRGDTHRKGNVSNEDLCIPDTGMAGPGLHSLMNLQQAARALVEAAKRAKDESATAKQLAARVSLVWKHISKDTPQTAGGFVRACALSAPEHSREQRVLGAVAANLGYIVPVGVPVREEVAVSVVGVAPFKALQKDVADSNQEGGFGHGNDASWIARQAGSSAAYLRHASAMMEQGGGPAEALIKEKEKMKKLDMTTLTALGTVVPAPPPPIGSIMTADFSATLDPSEISLRAIHSDYWSGVVFVDEGNVHKAVGHLKQP